MSNCSSTNGKFTEGAVGVALQRHRGVRGVGGEKVPKGARMTTEDGAFQCFRARSSLPRERPGVFDTLPCHATLVARAPFKKWKARRWCAVLCGKGKEQRKETEEGAGCFSCTFLIDGKC